MFSCWRKFFSALPASVGSQTPDTGWNPHPDRSMHSLGDYFQIIPEYSRVRRCRASPRTNPDNGNSVVLKDDINPLSATPSRLLPPSPKPRPGPRHPTPTTPDNGFSSVIKHDMKPLSVPRTAGAGTGRASLCPALAHGLQGTPRKPRGYDRG